VSSLTGRIGRLGLATLLLVLLAGPPVRALAASPPGTTCPVFPADNIWNTDISTLPINSHSAAWLSSTGATGGRLLHPDFGGAPYGIPFNVVSSSHATANFNFLYWRESDPTVATQQPQGPYPYGSDLQVEAPTDSHLLTIVSDTCKLYETSGTDYNGAHTGWSGSIFDLNSNALRPDTWTSADAAGLPIVPGLVRLDEVQAGAINHAIRFTVQQSDTSHLWPARHDAGSASNSNLPPMGARFRLKSGFNISTFNAQTQVVLTAMKHYGLIVADNGSNWYFQGTTDSGWNNEPYATMVSQLKTIPASAFEAVDESSLMIDPNSGQAAQPGPACTSAALSPSAAAPQALGASIVFTGTATVCPGPQFRYWVLAPGGSWTMQRDYGPAGWTWNTTGLAEGTYEIGVWARQAGSANTYDAFAITSFALGVDTCIAASLSPSVAPPQARGAVITFTASSTGCSSPQYEFWLLPPGGSWTQVRAYRTGTTWAFDSSLYSAGNFQVGVWARQIDSSSRYDAFFVSTYWISPPTGCVVSGLNSSAAAPQMAGTTITFTPQQAGCSKQYKFWLLAPGGSWTAVQGYSATSTWPWNTNGYASGVYEVGVWEGSASSPSSYESFAITTFSLGVLTCTSAAISGPTQPQPAGTPLTFTASSTRCGSPQYEFWLLPPGGSWSIKQAFGGASWTWNTTGLAPGMYQLGVWARQIGSTNAHDAYFIGTFQLG
jgi:hypothetical protein